MCYIHLFKTISTTVNLRVLVEKFTPRIVYVKLGVDFYAQTRSFHRKSHENCDRLKADECARHLAGGRVTISYDMVSHFTSSITLNVAG